MEYGLLVAFAAIEILDGLPQSTRRRLLGQIGRLRFAPEQFSDYNDHDHIGRRVEVNIFANHCIHYWIDSADRQVKVMRITSADR